MNYPEQIAKHFNDVHFGGNWTVSNMRETLGDVTLAEALTKVGDLNTIATLVFHINYFVAVVLKVLQGGKLDGNDKLSFDHPPFSSQEDWDNFLQKVYSDAERFTKLVSQLPENKLSEYIADEKYGTYYRNIHGIIEHTHYHLGQIAIIKKLIRNNESVSQ